MVRDDVDDHPHAVPAQGGVEAIEGGSSAELDRDVRVVDHVVAVGATRRRLEDRRAIEVGDPEVRQVGHDGGGVVESESGVELDAVGGTGRGNSGHRGEHYPERVA